MSDTRRVRLGFHSENLPMTRLTAVASSLFLAGLLGCSTVPAPPEVLVLGHDYTFQLPDSLPAGRTAFAFENAGQVPHEMILVGLRDGATLQEVATRRREGRDWQELVESTAAILIAPPGERSAAQVLADLEAGRTYALVCNFQDSDSAPPHTELGMMKSLHVY